MALVEAVPIIGPQVIALILGCILGSFYNVVIYRLPSGQSIVRPGSRCPACGNAIAAYDNIPMMSYLLLGGKCRRCKAPISLRYPLVEGMSGLLALLLFRRYGLHPQLAIEFIFCSLLLIIAMIDLDTVPHSRYSVTARDRAGPGVFLLHAPAFLVGFASWDNPGWRDFLPDRDRICAFEAQGGNGRRRYKAARDDRGFHRLAGGRIYHPRIFGFRHDYCSAFDVAVWKRPWLSFAVRPLSRFWRRLIHLLGPAFLPLVLFRSARDVGKMTRKCFLLPEGAPDTWRFSISRRTFRDSWRAFCGHRVGESIELLDGQGSVWECRITGIRRGTVSVRLIGKLDHSGCESPLGITLGLAMARSDTMDLVIRQATELGVIRLAVFRAMRSQYALSAETGRKEKAALVQDSGRGDLPERAGKSSRNRDFRGPGQFSHLI